MAEKAFTFLAEGRVNVLHCPVNVSASRLTATIQSYKGYTAIWDTGATSSVITKKVADELELKPISMTQVHTANGIRDCNVYSVDITLPNNINISNVNVTEATLQGFDLLIGMDIIGLGDFAVSNHQGNTMVSYRIPSDGGVDFVKQLHEQDKRNKSKTKSKKELKSKHKKERQSRKKARKNK